MRCATFLLLSGLSVINVLPTPGLADPTAVAPPSSRDPYGEHIAEAAQRFELSAAWIRAVLNAESNGDSQARSPKGAMGLMQIMPETWGELRVRHRLGNDPYDPHDNIIAGTAYIRLLYDRYGTPGWIAAYNAGPSRYEASLKGRPLPEETRAYVAAVAPKLGKDSVVDSTPAAPSDALVWTQSPLFAAQLGRTPAVDLVPISRRPNDATADTQPTAVVRDVSPIVPQLTGLFVARMSEGNAR